MSEFAVDLVELDRIVEDLDAFACRLAERVDELETVVGTVQADWEGAAARAQHEGHRRIRAGAREVQSALAGLHAAAGHAHTCYTAAVTANAQTWRGLL